ncbi:MAG: hypothetical protein NC218_02265 [Acetobacter sp.]|nr:hypothetical protein [Acetobacter sp.]
MKTTREEFRLKVADGRYLSFEEHGEYTQIARLTMFREDAAVFQNKDQCVFAITDSFYYHHGLSDIITKESTAKDRLKLFTIEHTVIQEETEEVPLDISEYPTNGEIVEAKAPYDPDYKMFLKENGGNLDKDSYELCNWQNLSYVRVLKEAE